MGKGGMVRLVLLPDPPLDSSSGSLFQDSPWSKILVFVLPEDLPPPLVFCMVDERLGPLGFMGSVPVFLHLEGQMRDESPMRIFILDLCFQKPKFFVLGSERREGRKLC